MVTLGAQDTGRKQTKLKNNISLCNSYIILYTMPSIYQNPNISTKTDIHMSILTIFRNLFSITPSYHSNNLQRSVPMPTSVSHISVAMVDVLALSVVACVFEPDPVKPMTLYLLLLR
jgi:hypothetical protein